MTVDHSKLLYSSDYNLYKNLGIYSGSIAVDTTSVSPGATRTWSSTVAVEPNSKFAFARIQANDVSLLGVPSALRWQVFPSANVVYQTLSLDPAGNGYFDLLLSMTVNDDQVTFRATAFNPNVGAYAFNSLSIGFVYAAHTLAS